MTSLNQNTSLFLSVLITIAVMGIAELRADELMVVDPPSLRQALAKVQPGDQIILRAGTYDMGPTVATSVDGTPDQPISMRTAGSKGYAVLQVDGLVGFRIQNKHWVFRGLHIQGDPERTQATVFMDGPNGCRNIHMVDCKISGSAGHGMKSSRTRDIAVDDVLVEFTELFDTALTGFDIVGGDRWTLRRNFVHDFGKLDTSISYGIFLKGGGADGVIEGNLIDGGNRPGTVGISFGGGRTGPKFMPLVGDKIAPEHRGGVSRNNIVVDTGEVAYHSNDAHNCVFYNNLTYGCSGFQRQSSYGKDPLLINNVIGKLRGADKSSSHNIEAGKTDWFQDPAQRDFSLTDLGVKKLQQSAVALPDNSKSLFGRQRDRNRPILGPILPQATRKHVWQDPRH